MRSQEVCEELIKVKLKSRHGVLELKGTKHFGVEHTHGTDLLTVEENRDTSGREESGIVIIFNQIVVLSTHSVDLDHNQVEKTVDDFEVG